MKSNEDIEKELRAIVATADPKKSDEASLAIVKICLEDSDPGRGATMLLGFAGGIAKGAGFTIEETEAGVRAGYSGKQGAFTDLKLVPDA